jgi:hypothetical protein
MSKAIALMGIISGLWGLVIVEPAVAGGPVSVASGESGYELASDDTRTLTPVIDVRAARRTAEAKGDVSETELAIEIQIIERMKEIVAIAATTVILATSPASASTPRPDAGTAVSQADISVLAGHIAELASKLVGAAIQPFNRAIELAATPAAQQPPPSPAAPSEALAPSTPSPQDKSQPVAAGVSPPPKDAATVAQLKYIKSLLQDKEKLHEYLYNTFLGYPKEPFAGGPREAIPLPGQILNSYGDSAWLSPESVKFEDRALPPLAFTRPLIGYRVTEAMKTLPSTIIVESGPATPAFKGGMGQQLRFLEFDIDTGQVLVLSIKEMEKRGFLEHLYTK